MGGGGGYNDGRDVDDGGYRRGRRAGVDRDRGNGVRSGDRDQRGRVRREGGRVGYGGWGVSDGGVGHGRRGRIGSSIDAYCPIFE